MDHHMSVDSVIQVTLDAKAEELEAKLDRDFMALCGPLVFGADILLRDKLELRATKRAGVTILLDTPGGIVEVVERIVDTIRHHYRDVRFLVLDRAMSAGTVLALSGDSIVMDYFAVLGPIDPQVPKNGKLVPALAYLIQLEAMRQRARTNALTAVDLQLVDKLDLAELEWYAQAKELSVSLLKSWLVKYKFKDWSVTETNKTPVTDDIKTTRADAIAKSLSDPEVWHSHGRGIPRNKLESDDLKLKIDHLEANAELAKLAKAYGRLLTDQRVREDLQDVPVIHYVAK